MAVTIDGELPEIAVEEVRRDVAHPPVRRQRLPVPLIGVESAKGFQQLIVQRSK